MHDLRATFPVPWALVIVCRYLPNQVFKYHDHLIHWDSMHHYILWCIDTEIEVQPFFTNDVSKTGWYGSLMLENRVVYETFFFLDNLFRIWEPLFPPHQHDSLQKPASPSLHVCSSGMMITMPFAYSQYTVPSQFQSSIIIKWQCTF